MNFFRDCLKSQQTEVKNICQLHQLSIIIVVSLIIIFSFEVVIATKQWNNCKREQLTAQLEQESKYNSPVVICGNGEDAQKEFVGYLLQKIVNFTTQTSIGLMIFIFAYFTWIAYRRYQKDLNELAKEAPKGNENKETPKGNENKKEKLEEKSISHFLTEVLVAALSISAIPTGISLIICAFYDIRFIKYMSGVEIYVAFAGISILSISFLSTLQEREQMEKDKNQETSDVKDLIKSETNKSSTIPEVDKMIKNN